MNSLEYYLTPGDIIDSGSDTVIRYTGDILKNEPLSDREKAIKLYYHIRDDIRYDPYVPFYRPEHYRSSNVIMLKKGFCIQKAGLLCAAGRAAGIPSRVGFATVKNHLATRQLLEYLGTDIFSFHGYTEFRLEGKWVKATPAFNIELCRLFKIAPLEFNGIDDSIIHEFNSDNEKFMEYLFYHGEFHDIPVDLILRSWEETYGKERVKKWRDNLEKKSGNSGRDFTKEEIA